MSLWKLQSVLEEIAGIRLDNRIEALRRCGIWKSNGRGKGRADVATSSDAAFGLLMAMVEGPPASAPIRTLAIGCRRFGPRGCTVLESDGDGSYREIASQELFATMAEIGAATGKRLHMPTLLDAISATLDTLMHEGPAAAVNAVSVVFSPGGAWGETTLSAPGLVFKTRFDGEYTKPGIAGDPARQTLMNGIFDALPGISVSMPPPGRYTTRKDIADAELALVASVLRDARNC